MLIMNFNPPDDDVRHRNVENMPNTNVFLSVLSRTELNKFRNAEKLTKKYICLCNCGN